MNAPKSVILATLPFTILPGANFSVAPFHGFSSSNFIERAILEHSFKNYEESIKYGKKALKIKTRKYTYINSEHSWDETIYDIMSINYYMIGNKKEGLKYLNKALKINPNNIRIKENKKYFI